MEPETYIVAVSGGVDSVALLHMLANHSLQNYQLPTTNHQLIVAHFDHGIREESGEDAEFVKDLAAQYGLGFEIGQANLGKDASEAKARAARYNFLRQCCKKYNASAIITAHHQDDLIETMIINLIRGTSWRGLVSISQTTNYNLQISNNDQISNIKYQILRPLLYVSKQEILEYAKKNQLQWHEDSTNADTNYLRNYIRLNMVPEMMKTDPNFKEKLLKIYKDTSNLKQEITKELQAILQNYKLQTTNYKLPRYQLIMWPDEVTSEVIYSILTELDENWHPTNLQIEKALLFIKTAQPNKELQISGQLRIVSSLLSVQFQKG
jgi:tRNA(Ile)-lysidine synthetase-like protein